MTSDAIDPKIVEAIESELVSLSEDKWKLALFELQEDGAFLGVVIDVPNAASDDAVRSYVQEIKILLQSRIATRSTGFAWMVSAHRKGKTIEVEFG